MRKNEENCRQILMCISTYARLNGCAPSFLELCRMCGLRSPAAVRNGLRQLEEENWITYDTSKAESIAVKEKRLNIGGQRYPMMKCG